MNQIDANGECEEMTQNEQCLDIYDIQEEWERSQDFIKKHRTIHPEEEPTYEKLLKIIIKANRGEGETDPERRSFNSRVVPTNCVDQ